MLTQNNVTNDHLTIVISAAEAKQFNAEAEESRAKVREMYANYQPALGGNGNGEGGKRAVDVEAEPVKPEDLAPIERKEGDEKSSAFWRSLRAETASGPFIKRPRFSLLRRLSTKRSVAAGATRRLWPLRASSLPWPMYWR